MSQLDPALLSQISPSNLHSRRRWVPKGVILLFVLLVVGLFNAGTSHAHQMRKTLSLESMTQPEDVISLRCWPVNLERAELQNAAIHRDVNIDIEFTRLTKNQF